MFAEQEKPLEQNPQWQEGASQGGVWGRAPPWRGKSRCKGSEVGSPWLLGDSWNSRSRGWVVGAGAGELERGRVLQGFAGCGHDPGIFS